MSTRTYITQLPEQECVERLLRHQKPFGWLDQQWTEGTIKTKTRGRKIRVFAFGPLRNSFAVAFFGRIEPQTAGTRIHGHFRMYMLVYLFLAVWFLGLAFMSGLVLFLPRAAWAGKAPPAWAAFGPLAMAGLGVALLAANRRYTQNQVKCVTRFFKEELRADEESHGSNLYAAPNADPATRLGNSGVDDGPPAVD